jgi:hypothetical protein
MKCTSTSPVGVQYWAQYCLELKAFPGSIKPSRVRPSPLKALLEGGGVSKQNRMDVGLLVNTHAYNADCSVTAVQWAPRASMECQRRTRLVLSPLLTLENHSLSGRRNAQQASEVAFY